MSRVFYPNKNNHSNYCAKVYKNPFHHLNFHFNFVITAHSFGSSLTLQPYNEFAFFLWKIMKEIKFKRFKREMKTPALTLYHIDT